MASEKSPSIYIDRGTIGSSEELDEYGVWIKSEPQDLSSLQLDSRKKESPIPDIDLPDFTEEPETGAAIESIDDLTRVDNFADFMEENSELPGVDLDIFGEAGEEEDIPGFTGNDEDGIFEDFAESGDAFPEEERIVPEDIETDYQEIPVEDFPHIDIPSGELPDETPPVKPAAKPSVKTEAPKTGTEGESDLSTRLLLRIAEELAVIKGELSDLKQELVVVRGGASSEKLEETAAATGRGGGFFDEEEDEKIALTGDEMDNILHTAKFTEETGSDATETITDEFAGTEKDLSESFPAAEEKPEAPEESPDLSPEPPDEIAGKSELSLSEDIDIEYPTDLRELMEQGAKPLTPTPEDTSYLDEDPLAFPQEEAEELSELSPEESVDLSMDESPAEPLDFPSIDLSDAVIDEPDLGAVLKENPIEEPSLDHFSIDLDLEESPVEEPIGPEPMEEEILLEPSMEIADLNADDLLDADTEAILNAAALVDPGEEEAPVDGTGAINLEDTGDFYEIEDSLIQENGVPKEEDFAQVIPEGFVVESEDSSAPLDDIGDMAAESGNDVIEITPEGIDESPAEEKAAAHTAAGSIVSEDIPPGLKQELRNVLSYMDKLLEALPENKIEEFAKSEHFDAYKKLFEELGLA
ncbi:MAG: hypothetical protein LBD78_07425 [Spirochaetaceae bacterium]|jgi:hypothetical protein|nr:hypothetical protein [Spirochaetaceae bacterium]